MSMSMPMSNTIHPHAGGPTPSIQPSYSSIPGSGSGSAPKKRRRIHLNCEECRRTKSRCNRSWPCSECVKKGLAHICPNQVSKISQPKSQTISDLTDRVKQLEDVLRHHGLEAEIPAFYSSPEPTHLHPFTTSPPPMAPPSGAATAATAAEPPQSRAWDMTAMLGELTSSTQSKGYAGTEGSAFYLSSPDGNDSDNEGEDEGVLAEFPTPWMKRAGEDWKGGNRSGSLLAKCRAMLPTQEQSKAMFEHFWQATAWRIQPMSRSFFLERIIPNIYESTEGAHAHDLAVLFAVKAMSELFQPTPDSPFAPQDYHELSYACLVAGKFYTETTTASLISLHLLANFFINSDDRKMVDAIFAIIGMAMRLAVIAGYHRDMPYRHLPREDLDHRRRIWFELLAVERVHCLPSLLPGSISPGHYDVSFPTDAHPDGYFVCKWRLGRYMSRVIDCWTSRTAPATSTISSIDAGLRRLYHSIPQQLVCSIMPSDAYRPTRDADTNPRHSIDGDSRPNMAPPPTDVSDGSPKGQVEIQQIRLAQHFVMVFFYLHRPSFMQTLAKGGDMNSLSLQTMLETCRHMVNLLKTAMGHDHSTVSRWFGFAADLFTTLHCPTALVVKTTDQPLAAQQMILLEEGASVIEWIAIVRPSSKNRALAAGTRRLVATARTRYLSFGTVKTEPMSIVPHGQSQSQGRQPAISNYIPSPSQSRTPHQQSRSHQPQRNGSWGNGTAQGQAHNHYQQPQQSQQSQLHGQLPPHQFQRPGISPSDSSINNGFDWSSFPVFPNTQTQHQHQQQPQALSQPQAPMQMLPVGQLSPIDLGLPLSSPVQSMSGAQSNNNVTGTFGHLPMMPNQMDNWPLSMQNLGQLGMTPAPDPYAPSSEGFDMWLASILADGNGNGAGTGGGAGAGTGYGFESEADIAGQGYRDPGSGGGY